VAVWPVKDQYAADVNDYLKYALLRALSAAHCGRLHVCWMLTAPDGRSDGSRLSYLNFPERFRGLDPPLFDELLAVIADGRRSVEAIQDAGVLGNARFHSALLSDSRDSREGYLRAFWDALGKEELVFFDPDNGLEVRSTPPGRRGSSKYLYWDELAAALDERRAACVYQHFPRVVREAYINGRLTQMRERFPGHDAFAVSTSWVAYLVCARPTEARRLLRAARALAERAGSGLTVSAPPSEPVRAGARSKPKRASIAAAASKAPRRSE
jgi:hypothetical protein